MHRLKVVPPRPYEILLSKLAESISETVLLSPPRRREFIKNLNKSVEPHLKNTGIPVKERREIENAMEFLIQALLHPESSDGPAKSN